MATTSQKVIYWVPTVLWAILIYGLSSQPSLRASQVPSQDFILRKLAHIGEYLILALLLYRSITKTTHISRVKAVLFTVIVSVAYAISDEFHQTQVYDRTGKFTDVLIDSVGILLLVPWIYARPIEK